MSNLDCEFLVIGAGMAGASIAAELAVHASVIVIEAEDQPGYHSTGRSAAFWTESYGGPQVQPLTTASGPWLQEHGFLTARGALTLARENQQRELDAFVEQFRSVGVRVDILSRDEIERLVPGTDPAWTCAAYEPDCCDIDVAGVHAHFLSELRRAGADLRLHARLANAIRTDWGWQVTLQDGAQIRCARLVNAAGAWADNVAEIAGIAPLNIQPMRRTVVQLRVDPPISADLPLVLDIAEEFYFKPENGRLWLSPHDETPCEPCDAAPEEMDVAIAIDRFARAVDWRIETIEHRWAGLRSFAPDRLPVYGPDPLDRSFVWFAGQGGFGIQTAPAAAQLGAALILNLPLPAKLRDLDARIYSPDRFRRGN